LRAAAGGVMRTLALMALLLASACVRTARLAAPTADAPRQVAPAQCFSHWAWSKHSLDVPARARYPRSHGRAQAVLAGCVGLPIPCTRSLRTPRAKA
jgi:hypothetical protein